MAGGGGWEVNDKRINMKIGGIQAQSLIDWPDEVCAVFFAVGCNFKCPFCYNIDLVLEKSKIIPEKEIENFLEERKNFLDAIMLSGGEPTMQNDLPEFIKKIKSYGYKVGIETNGTNPDMIERLLKEKLLDFIAMDIKSDFESYEKTVRAKVNIKKIKKSIELIKNSNMLYEFRTTIVPGLFDENTAEKIGELLKGAKKYVLQQFVNENNMLDNSYKKIKPYSLSELDKFKKILQKRIKDVEIKHSKF